MLVVSSVIGVGIFLTPGAIAEALPHPGMFLLAWLVGGLLSLTGALANAELGAMFPHAGGDYVYLREAWHPAAGFAIGWLSFFVIYAGTIATLAVGFADGIGDAAAMDASARTAIAVAITLGASLVNYRGVRLGAFVNNVTAVAKIAALAALALIGPLLGGGEFANLRPLLARAGDVSLASFGLALSPVLFSYLGWNASVFVASEVRDAERNIPRSLFLGLAICMAIYLLLNVAYLHALPIDVLRGDSRAGESAARVFFGDTGAAITSVLILVSVVSCLNATILVGPRIVYAMALDGLFPPAVSAVHRRFQTPHVAIVVQALTATALIVLLRRFPSVLDYTTFAIVLATIADTAALYALRRRRPQQARPYRAWGYPVVPGMYLLANVAIAVTMLQARPLECLVALAVAATAAPAYLVLTHRRSAT